MNNISSTKHTCVYGSFCSKRMSSSSDSVITIKLKANKNVCKAAMFTFYVLYPLQEIKNYHVGGTL
jgi:hypothetical protein